MFLSLRANTGSGVPPGMGVLRGAGLDICQSVPTSLYPPSLWTLAHMWSNEVPSVVPVLSIWLLMGRLGWFMYTVVASEWVNS